MLTSIADGSVHLTSASVRRLAFRFIPTVINALLPERSIGVYMLLQGDTPVYVGRSDHCLRQRLSRHNHLRAATHVTWEFTPTVQHAYVLEAHLFHRHHNQLINKIHPALPTNSAINCPFCAPNTDKALARAINRDNSNSSGASA